MVKQYKKLLRLDGIELRFQEEALKEIAHRAIERKTGARGLRGIMEDVLGQVMFDSPSDATISQVLITPEAVKKEAPPKLTRDETITLNRQLVAKNPE